jgi:hypothetical protein
MYHDIIFNANTTSRNDAHHCFSVHITCQKCIFYKGRLVYSKIWNIKIKKKICAHCADWQVRVAEPHYFQAAPAEDRNLGVAPALTVSI